ncbi:MAG: hypothetical protein U0169_02750 [Polyangiaceae bacterium]
MIDCRDIASASKDPVPCYVDSAVIQLVASQNQEEFDRQAPKYLGAINEIYLKKGERLISRKTYDAELASYKDSVIAQYTRALTQLSDLDLCKVRNDAYTETVAAREQSRIGAFIYDTCDLALQDSFDKRIDAAAKTEIATRIGGLSSDIRARTTFRGIRENWVGDDKMAEVLQAAFRGASAAVSTYVQSYKKGIKRTSAVVKTVANVATVVAATLLVPATGGASAVAMSVLTVGTAAGTVEVVLTKLDDVDASAVRAFARGFASGAIPTLFQAGTTALVAQLARTRLLSGATMGGLSYLENVTVGALSAGSLHVVESAIAGKPIDLTDLLTHTLTGGFLGGAIFSAHTVAKLGWAARIRTKNQKLLDPMAFEGVATKLGYMGLAGRKDPSGNVDWSGVYDDLAPLLATQQGRATTLAKLANDPQAKSPPPDVWSTGTGRSSFLRRHRSRRPRPCRRGGRSSIAWTTWSTRRSTSGRSRSCARAPAHSTTSATTPGASSRATPSSGRRGRSRPAPASTSHARCSRSSSPSTPRRPSRSSA